MQIARAVRECISLVEQETGKKINVMSLSYNRLMNHVFLICTFFFILYLIRHLLHAQYALLDIQSLLPLNYISN